MSDGFTFHVDLTSIMLFASAIGEENKIYYDEKYAAKTPLQGVIAPPTFVQANAHWNPDYPLRGVRKIPASDKPKDPPKIGGGNTNRVLHGEQHFEYFKPVRPGMKLTITSKPGKSWEKQSKRGGLLKFSEGITEYHDEHGELVVRATSVGIVTEKVVGS